MWICENKLRCLALTRKNNIRALANCNRPHHEFGNVSYEYKRFVQLRKVTITRGILFAHQIIMTYSHTLRDVLCVNTMPQNCLPVRGYAQDANRW